MKAALPVFILIDACGWEIVKEDPFGGGFARCRTRLESVFGYSSACIPTILSGRWPVEHRNWCYFVYDPVRSPFKRLKPLRWLPPAVTGRRIFRRWLSRMLKRPLNFRGYFDLYNIPFRHISLFDFTEKKSPLRPRGMNCGSNIFDHLEERRIPYFVSDPDRGEAENRQELIREIRAERIDFAFLYWPGMDGLIHEFGNDSPRIPAKLRVYEEWIDQILAAARSHYAETRLYVFGDHGMANCDVHLDLRAKLDGIESRPGKDYAAVYDSTMARFWFFDEKARGEICERLAEVKEGRILLNEELEELHALFPDRYFGQTIFLVREGVLIVPSDMGARPIRAMHGYHPSEKHSFAAFLTNLPSVSPGLRHIRDIYGLMREEAEWAGRANLQPAAGGFAARFASVEGRSG